MTSAGTNTSSPIACVFQFLHVSYLAEWAIGYLIWFVQTRKVSRFQVWNESRYIAIIAAKKFVEIRSNYLITSQTNSLLLIMTSYKEKRAIASIYGSRSFIFFYLSATEVQVISILLPQSKWAKSQNHPCVALTVNKSYVQMWTSPLGLLLTSALAVIHSHLFYNGLLQSTQHPKSTPTDGRMELGVCPMFTPMVV